MRALQSPFSKKSLLLKHHANLRLFASAATASSSSTSNTNPVSVKLIRSSQTELQYKSGETAPFRVVRTKNNLYPVYTDYHNARSSKRTIVRKIEGDYAVCLVR
jgi:hypothetical protein